MNGALKLVLAAYSVVHWTLGFAWMTLFALPGSFLCWSFRRPRWQLHLSQKAMRVVPRLNFVTFRRTQHPDHCPQRASVYAFNHVNMYDASSACEAIHAPFCGLMNSWQFKIPIYGWIMWLTCGIPVASSPLERARTLPGLFRERAALGLSVLTFPEAHRTTTGNVQEFKRGITQLARDANLPIVPVAVRGMFRVMQKGSLIVRPFKRVQIWVGPQLETTDLSKGQMTRLTKAIEEMVRDFVDHGREPDVVARLVEQDVARAYLRSSNSAGNSRPPA